MCYLLQPFNSIMSFVRVVGTIRLYKLSTINEVGIALITLPFAKTDVVYTCVSETFVSIIGFVYCLLYGN